MTSLLLFAVLEVVFYYGYLNVTEAGGCFFLHFIWRIVGEQPVEAKKGRKENSTAWHLAGGRG